MSQKTQLRLFQIVFFSLIAALAITMSCTSCSAPTHSQSNLTYVKKHHNLSQAKKQQQKKRSKGKNCAGMKYHNRDMATMSCVH